MRFIVGDSVRLRVDKDYDDDHVPAGRRGVVQKVYPKSERYLIRFVGITTPHRVPDSDLDPA
jgi:hypothetical protein